MAAARHTPAEPVEYGAALMALSPQRRDFVLAYLRCGSGSEAARRAGYSASSPGTTAKQAYNLLHDARILAAIAEESPKIYRALAVKAIRETERILDDPRAKDRDKLSAAHGVLSRSDPVITSQIVSVSHSHEHRHTLSVAETTERILALAAKVGVALPPPVDVVDVVAEEVVP